MSLKLLRQRLINAIKSEDLDVRKAAINELANSQVSDRYRILELWSAHESNPIIKSKIDKILLNADWFDNSQQNKIEYSREQNRIRKLLLSDDLEQVKKVFKYLVKNRRKEFLKIMLGLEKKFDDNYLKFCNISLLGVLGDRSIQHLKNYLDFPDQEVQRMAIRALTKLDHLSAIEICLLKSSHMGPFISTIVSEALVNWPKDRLLQVIRKFSEDSDPNLRLQAAYWCSRVKHKLSFEYCQILIGDDEQSVVQAAWEAIEVLADQISEAKHLLTQIGNQNKLAELQRERKKFHLMSSVSSSFSELVDQFHSGDNHQKASILQRVGFLESTDHSILKFVEDCLQSEDPRIRANAIEALGQLEHQPNKEMLLKYLNDPNNRVVGNTCLVLYRYDDEFHQQIFNALRKLGSSTQEAPRLTVLFCADQTRDERLLPLVREQFCQTEFDLVRERALNLMQDWGAQRPNVLYDLEEWKRSFQIHLDIDEPLDEFID